MAYCKLNAHIKNADLINLQDLKDDLPYTKSAYYKCSSNLQELNGMLLCTIRTIIGHREAETGRKVIFIYSCVYTRVVHKIRFSMNFHNEKHVYWH
jgi:hypothetical protein